jgi:hypothetical protein
MGNIVTTHEVISDKVVAKVIGDLGKQHIEAIEAFLERDDVDCNREFFVNNELDWSGDGVGEGMFEGDDSDYSDEVKAAFQNLLKQKEEIQRLFKEQTGMKLYLVYNEPEDAYDGIDGYAWALTFTSVFQHTPNYDKFIQQYGEETTWSQVVKYG